MFWCTLWVLAVFSVAHCMQVPGGCPKTGDRQFGTAPRARSTLPLHAPRSTLHASAAGPRPSFVLDSRDGCQSS